jgi:hypothetical protein
VTVATTVSVYVVATPVCPDGTRAYIVSGVAVPVALTAAGAVAAVLPQVVVRPESENSE